MPAQIARIALDAPLDRLFDYLAGEATHADIGRRVSVPFGRQTLVGVLLELATESPRAAESLKALHHIDRETPPLPADLIALARFAAGYYHAPLGAVLASLLPPLLRRASAKHAPARRPALLAVELTAAGEAALATLPARAKAQRALLGRLQAGPVRSIELTPGERARLRAWLAEGWVAGCAPGPAETTAPDLPVLTVEQTDAVTALTTPERLQAFTPWLLHGITGSGKTEVYLRLIDALLQAGRQALLLVPEIHLTPQLTERVAQRFPGRRLLSLHSGLGDAERRGAWLAALEGAADIVLGTRLAVFTPMPRLGLIIVDEEHDSAFKQLEGMRYSARDVAVWRAKQRNVPVLLGSATPSLETWRNAREGRYHLLRLTARAHSAAAPPAVRLIDTRRDRPRNGLSEALTAALRLRLERGEQSLVFINRRGYAPALLCNGCGHVFPCPRCSANLVLHRHARGARLLCHHCGLIARPPETCPACGHVDLRTAGQGTQRVEETLAALFPEARLLRIDRDTASRKGAFAEMKAQVEAREVDILVGTQILAKGHDFPHLTLVGVTGADQALVSPDFRAGERLFAQLMQVAGRAGRADHPGEVLIQTAYPMHPIYQALAAHDYPGFAKQALGERREAGFPPYSSQVVLRAEGRDEPAVQAFLQAARDAGEEISRAQNSQVQLFDPVPALMRKVAHHTRMQLLAQADARPRLQAFLSAWHAHLHTLPAKGVRWGLDVDPLDV